MLDLSLKKSNFRPLVKYTANLIDPAQFENVGDEIIILSNSQNSTEKKMWNFLAEYYLRKNPLNQTCSFMKTSCYFNLRSWALATTVATTLQCFSAYNNLSCRNICCGSSVLRPKASIFRILPILEVLTTLSRC